MVSTPILLNMRTKKKKKEDKGKKYFFAKKQSEAKQNIFSKTKQTFKNISLFYVRAKVFSQEDWQLELKNKNTFLPEKHKRERNT